MRKFTIRLPDDHKAALVRLAADKGKSQSQLVRDAVSEMLRGGEATRPRLPLFHSGDPTLAERYDESLRGFGQN